MDLLPKLPDVLGKYIILVLDFTVAKTPVKSYIMFGMTTNTTGDLAKLLIDLLPD